MKTLEDFEVSNENDVSDTGTIIHVYTSSGEKLYLDFERIHTYMLSKGVLEVHLNSIYRKFPGDFFSDSDTCRTKGFLLEIVLNDKSPSIEVSNTREVLCMIERSAENGDMESNDALVKLWHHFGTKDLYTILTTWVGREMHPLTMRLIEVKDDLIPKLSEAIDTDSNIAGMPVQWILKIFSI